MSTHTDNQPEENGSSRGRVIVIAVTIYLAVAGIAYFMFFALSPDNLLEEAVATPSAAGAVTTPAAFYLAPADETLLTASEVAASGLRPVATLEELGLGLAEFGVVETIYVHPRMLVPDNAAYLQQQLANGRLLVALNTTLSDFGRYLEVIPIQPDLPVAEMENRGIGVSAIALTADQNRQFEYTGSFVEFGQAPIVVENLREAFEN